jgi:hypothetical protein
MTLGRLSWHKAYSFVKTGELVQKLKLMTDTKTAEDLACLLASLREESELKDCDAYDYGDDNDNLSSTHNAPYFIPPCGNLRARAEICRLQNANKL